MSDLFLDCALTCSVRLDPAARDTAALAAELIAAAVADGLLGVSRQADALAAVLRREQAASTLLPGGLSLPHARIEGLEQMVVALGIHRAGADLGAPDGEPTRITVLMLVPADAGNGYVRLLGRFSRCMQNAVTRGRLLTAATADDVRRALST